MDSYFTKKGRLPAATHPRTGPLGPGDRVRMFLNAGWEYGTVEYLTRGNGGTGRPFACVRWDAGHHTTEPVGRLKRP